MDQRLNRTYSLSAAPDPKVYRLTIKRQDKGQVSRFLHDVLQEGDILNAHPPAGEFVLKPGTRAVVLLSAGVGLTPMTSMLGALARPEEKRAVWFVHGARDGAHHPLAAEVRLAAQGNPRVQAHMVYSKPRPEDLNGQEYDHVGHIDISLIETVLPILDADFYLCGPVPFMAAIQDGLEARGVPPEQIHRETFGPLGEVIDEAEEAS
jgi:ferredoxin-NADP reductase